MSRRGWTPGDEARLKRFAALAARFARLETRAEAHDARGIFIGPMPVAMSPDVAAMYEAKMAEHRARFGPNPGINPHAHTATADPAIDQASQLLRARHAARIGA